MPIDESRGDGKDGRVRFPDDRRRGVPLFHVDLEQADGGACVLSVKGELDLHTSRVFGRALDAARERRPTSVVVDLAECSLIDSTGLGMLVKAGKGLRHSTDARIAIACPDPSVRKVFEVTALDRLFPICPTRSSALAALADGAGAGHPREAPDDPDGS
ncbi:MAG: STAS domain-containing protein [Gaiellaceae bacterium]